MKPRRSVKEMLAERLPPSLKFRLKCAVADARHRLGRLKAREHDEDDVRLAASAADGRDGPFVLVVDDSLPRPDRDAGSARMVFILRALSEWSRPVFVYLSKHEWPEYKKPLWEAGVETARAVHLRRLMRERNFDFAVLSRPETAEAVAGEVRRAGRRIKVVFDMVDAHFVRFGREHELTGDAEAAAKAERFLKIETRLARRSDLVWCASDADAAALAREVPGVRTEIIPTIHQLRDRGKSFEERRGLLFLGNFRHRPNADAVHFFVREIFPAVRAAVREAELYVVGDEAPPEISAYASVEGVKVLGYVPDIAPLFAGCRLMVAPLRFGAGIKGKIGEALAHGLPVVTTDVGAEGMGFTHGEEALVANDPREFARRVARAYKDAELWQRLSDKGYEHVRRRFTPEVVGRVVNDSLKKLGGLARGGVRREDHSQDG